MKKLFFLVCLFILLIQFGLVRNVYPEELAKQKISIITLTKDFNSLMIESLLYSKLMETNEVIIKDTFGELPTDFLFFMYQNKISGLVIISNSNIMIYTTKGLITNMSNVTPNEISNVSSYLLSVYKPAPPEKIYKDIEKIDYISPLEETNIRPSISIGIALYNPFPIEGIYTNVTNTSGGNTNIYQDNILKNNFGQNGVAVSLGFGIDTRYFSFDTSLRVGMNSTYYGASVNTGVWLLKGFLMVGLGIEYSRYEFNLRDYVTNIFSNDYRSALNYINLSPILKFKFDKTSSLTVIPLIGFTIVSQDGFREITDNNIKSTLMAEVGEPSGPIRFLCLKVLYEQGIFGNTSLVFNSVISLVSTDILYQLKEGYPNYYVKTSEVYALFSLGVKYKF
jgi:hypothetical protein